MNSRSPVGTTSTKFDLVLDQYFPQRSGNWLYQILENRTDALLLALLYEMQVQNRGEGFELEQEDSSRSEPDYWVTETPIQVDSIDSRDARLEWNFSADTVTVWGFEEPIMVSFRRSGSNRRIPLEPDDGPFTLSPEGGLGASEISMRLWTGDQEPTSAQVLALR